MNELNDQLNAAIEIIADQLPDQSAQVLRRASLDVRESLMRGWLAAKRIDLPNEWQQLNSLLQDGLKLAPVRVLNAQAVTDSLLALEHIEAVTNGVDSALPEKWRRVWEMVKDNHAPRLIPQWLAEGNITWVKDGAQVDGVIVQRHLLSMFPEDPEEYFGDQWMGWPADWGEVINNQDSMSDAQREGRACAVCGREDGCLVEVPWEENFSAHRACRPRKK